MLLYTHDDCFPGINLISLRSSSTDAGTMNILFLKSMYFDVTSIDVTTPLHSLLILVTISQLPPDTEAGSYKCAQSEAEVYKQLRAALMCTMS